MKIRNEIVEKEKEKEKKKDKKKKKKSKKKKRKKKKRKKERKKKEWNKYKSVVKMLLLATYYSSIAIKRWSDTGSETVKGILGRRIMNSDDIAAERI